MMRNTHRPFSGIIWTLGLIALMHIGCSNDFDLNAKTACRSDSDCPVNQLCQGAALGEDGQCAPIGSGGGTSDVGVDAFEDGGLDASAEDVEGSDVLPDTSDDVLEPDAGNDAGDAGAENIAPIARVDGPIVGVVGISVAFDGSRSSDADGDIVSWVWDFGDGTEGSGERVAQTYNTTGEFRASLTVVDNDGAEARTFVDVLIVPSDTQEPQAAIGLDAEVVLVGTEVMLRGDRSIDPDGEIVAWEWFLLETSTGTERTFAEANPQLRFESVGNVEIQLTVRDNEGLEGRANAQLRVGSAPQAAALVNRAELRVGELGEFDASASIDGDGTIEQYIWDFGDGSTTTGVSPSHTFVAPGAYDVRVLVIDDDGFSSEAGVEVTVVENPVENMPPVANAGEDRTVDIDEQVVLDASGSTDSDGEVVGYLWELPDGMTFSRSEVRVAYPQAGVYPIVLTVTDDDGATASDTVTITVREPVVGNEPPVADAGNDRTADVGVSIPFSSAGSGDIDGEIVAYSWDFGDGQQSTDANPMYAYGTAGIYQVVLTVTDDDGAIAQDSITVTVRAANQPPVADAGPDQTVRLGESVVLDGSGSFDPDGTIETHVWTFGPDEIQSGETTSYTWDQVGTFDVELVVIDDRGAQGSDRVRVTVEAINQDPDPQFTVQPETWVINQEGFFNASASSDPDGDGIASYTWDFGDGSNGTGVETSHTYDAPGTYTVRLTVTDERGASASAFRDVEVECSVDCYTGRYRKDYGEIGQDEPLRGACEVNGPSNAEYTFALSPSDCDMAIVLGSIIMDCDGQIYTGEFSDGENFTVETRFQAENPGGATGSLCGDAFVEETITGRFDQDGRWTGQSDLELTISTPGCGSCSYQPVDVFGSPL